MNNKIILLYCIMLFIACNSKVETKENSILEENEGKVDAPITMTDIWKNLPLRKIPTEEATNFNNVANDRFLTKEEIVV